MSIKYKFYMLLNFGKVRFVFFCKGHKFMQKRFYHFHYSVSFHFYFMRDVDIKS